MEVWLNRVEPRLEITLVMLTEIGFPTREFHESSQQMDAHK